MGEKHQSPRGLRVVGPSGAAEEAPRVRYTWDEGGRLRAVAGPPDAEAYGYDAAGRLERVGPAGGEGEGWRIAYGRGEEIATIHGPGGEVLTVAPRPDEGPLAVGIGTSPEGTTRYRLAPRADGGPTLQITAPDGARIEQAFDAEGRLITLQGPAGRTAFAWDAEGRLASVVGPDRVRVTLSRDAEGRLETVVTSGRPEGEGETLRLSWHGPGRLENLTREPDGRSETWTWDADRPARVTFGDGRSVRYVWDGGLLTQVTATGEGVEETTRFEHDATGRAIVRADGDALTRFTYDEAGRLSAITYPDEGLERFTWDALGNLLGHTDAAGRVTSQRFDRQGRLRAVSRGEGDTLTLTHGADGRLATVRGPLGLTTWEWTAAGQPQRVTHPDGVVEDFAYDAAGRLLTHRRDGVAAWSGRYDGVRLSEERFEAGALRRYRYDPLGRVVAVALSDGPGTLERSLDITRPAGGRVRITDAAAGLIEELGPVGTPLDPLSGEPPRIATRAVWESSGRAVALTYDTAGRLKEEAASDGMRRLFTHDPMGRLVRMALGDGPGVNLSWDTAGRPRVLSDDSGHVRLYTRDARGALTAVTIGEARWEYTYDTAGRLASITNPGGAVRRFGWSGGPGPSTIEASWRGAGQERLRYEGARLVERTGPDGSVLRYRWDDAGRLVGIDGGAGASLALRWDGGFLTEDRGPDHHLAFAHEGGGRILTEVDHGARSKAVLKRDAAGRPTERSLELPGGQRHTVVYTRRADGLLAGVSASGIGTMRFAHDTIGRRVRAELPGGGGIHTDYDEQGRVAALWVTDPEGRETWRADLRHDAYGRLSAVEAKGLSQTYGHDAMQRLERVTLGEGDDERTLTYATRASGDLTRLRGEGVEADRAGRPLRVGDRLFAWDRLGRLTGISGGGEPEIALRHDGLGRLSAASLGGRTVSWRTDFRGRLLARDDGRQVRAFHHLGEALLAESVDGALAARFLPGEARGERLALARQGTVAFIVQHPDGSTLALVDGAGRLISQMAHEPYGARVFHEGPELDPWAMRGHYRDPEVGLIHYPLRWYAPQAGVFIAPDPDAGDLMHPETLHPFAYLEGDPVNRHDPLGAAGYEWSLRTSSLQGVCDLFQRGKIEASHAFGNTLEGFRYQGAIDRGGWAYDVWSKRVPGTDRVVTIIRDLNEKTGGPYGKTNITGNIVLRDSPAAQEAPQQVSRLRSAYQQLKQGVQLHAREVMATVGTLGGLKGTLGSALTVIASYPGGLTIIGLAVAGSAAIGYGTGSLINQVPGVSDLTQRVMSGVFGFEQDRLLIQSRLEQDALGERAREIQAQRIEDYQRQVKASGLPSLPPDPGVAGGTTRLDPPQPPPEPPPAPEPEPDPAPEVDPIAALTPKRVHLLLKATVDGSTADFGLTVVCESRLAFWHVGALQPGRGAVEITGSCTQTVQGRSMKVPHTATGTFSGGPNGVIRMTSHGVTSTVQLRGGRVAVVPQLGEVPLEPADVFADWPAGYE